MSDLTRSTAADLAAALADGSVTSVEVTQQHLDRIAAVDGEIHAYLHVDAEGALAAAAPTSTAAATRGSPAPPGRRADRVKDVLTTTGLPPRAARGMLEGWIPPYDATVVSRLKAAGLPILGKTNMDEFAMGSSTEHSAYGPTRNPWDTDRIPGGSGGGSAAAVAAFEAPLAVGTDTGGSIVSPRRHRDRRREAHVRRCLALRPRRDGQQPRPGRPGHPHRPRRSAAARGDGRTRPPRLHQPRRPGAAGGPRPPAAPTSRACGSASSRARRRGLPAGVRQRFEESIELLAKAGAEIVEVSCPSFAHGLAAYYLVMPSEVSSNLAKFDAMRYGLRVSPDGVEVPSAEQVMAPRATRASATRSSAAIILGTYALSSGYLRRVLRLGPEGAHADRARLRAAFEQVDVLASPTSPAVRGRLGEKLDDPLAMYAQDIATIPATSPACRHLAADRPVEGLPVGLQFLAPRDGRRPPVQRGCRVERLVAERAAALRRTRPRVEAAR